ncbi:MAG TPA: universal stress protein [Candidatus Binataceae bacterium]|nr:universal stress protein [Candidatus Binataceae bacterium]
MTFRTILSAVDFDENSMAAMETAAKVARMAGARVHVLHVLTGAPRAAEIDKQAAHENAARERLRDFCARPLGGIAHEVDVRTGDPAVVIIRKAEELKADLIVIAVHASRPHPRPFAGSVTERVVREATCPVVTVRPHASGDPEAVGSHMTAAPLTASPGMTVARVRLMMIEGHVRSIPVVEDGKLVGMVTDRDIAFSDPTPDTTVGILMTREVIGVSPRSSIQEAARVLLECEVEGLPVIEDGKLVGIITRSDILKTFAGVEPAGA